LERGSYCIRLKVFGKRHRRSAGEKKGDGTRGPLGNGPQPEKKSNKKGKEKSNVASGVGKIELAQTGGKNAEMQTQGAKG